MNLKIVINPLPFLLIGYFLQQINITNLNNLGYLAMGRHSTGAMTNKEAMRIEISYLLKKGFIKKGCLIQGSLSWTNENNITFYSNYFKEEKFIRLVYTLTDNVRGEKYDYDYKINFVEKPSNLGKGKILFFVCPETQKNCRILYKCYGSHKWKCRKAYKNFIYYNYQIVSKYDYYNTRYWQIDKQIKEMEALRKTHLFKGKPTKRYLKLQSLKDQREKFDRQRWTIGVPLRVRQDILYNSFRPDKFFL